MVSTRGVKFKFTEGERVLCYEPDPTKAKVLYESKVLELVVTRDNRGRKTPEYLVHFQGWNSSWDRCVGEDFVLPDTPENRNLQRKLSQDAAIHLKGKKRKKLPAIFKEPYVKKRCSDRENSEDSDETDDESPEDDEDESQVETEEDEPEEENEQGGNPFSDLKLSDNLKAILENDCLFISSKNKLLKLPCEPNIIRLLESYVKRSSVSLLTMGNNGKAGSMTPEDVEAKIKLSKELVDGLRIFFDFTLPSALLYKEERQQFENIDILRIPETSNPPESPSHFLPALKERGDEVSGSLKEESLPWHSFHPLPDPALSPAFPSAKPLPLTPRPSRPRQTNCKPMRKVSSPGPCENSVATMRTRTWARSQSLMKCNQDHNHLGEDGGRRVLRSSDKNRPLGESPKTENQSEPSVGSTCSSPPPLLSPTKNDKPGKCFLSPPLALNLTSISSVSSSASSTHSDSSHKVLRDPSGLLKKVLAWQILPANHRALSPSLLYGPQHLLRLFVKLPEYLERMCIPKSKRGPLLIGLQSFLNYVDERSEELFTPTAYKDIGEMQNYFEIKKENVT